MHQPGQNSVLQRMMIQQSTLQEKLISQRPMSHQVRDSSPIASQQAKPIQVMSKQGNPISAGGYLSFESKKREINSKLAPKMPLPMSQDLTNLVNQQDRAKEDAGKLGEPRQKSQSMMGPKSGASNSNPIRVSQTTRGMSPSFHTNSKDVNIKNRTSLQSYKRASAQASNSDLENRGVGIGNPPRMPGAMGRPVSAQKARLLGDSDKVSQSLVIKSQSSSSTAQPGSLNQSVTLQKQIELSSRQGIGGSTVGKNMMSSFRNGPIK